MIEAIEFALHRDGNKVWEDIGLGISGLTESEKEVLKNSITILDSDFSQREKHQLIE